MVGVYKQYAKGAPEWHSLPGGTASISAPSFEGGGGPLTFDLSGLPLDAAVEGSPNLELSMHLVADVKFFKVEKSDSVDSGTYPLGEACKELLSSADLSQANCSSSSSEFQLPNTDKLMNDPNTDVCGITNGYIAEAINRCFSAACNGQLGNAESAADHESVATQNLEYAADLCGSSGTVGSVTCAFEQYWSCP